MAANRQAFAASVLELLKRFDADGIDLDWEYPAIPGYPEHRYVPEDKQHFTLLVRELRQVLGDRFEDGLLEVIHEVKQGTYQWEADSGE